MLAHIVALFSLVGDMLSPTQLRSAQDLILGHARPLPRAGRGDKTHLSWVVAETAAALKLGGVHPTEFFELRALLGAAFRLLREGGSSLSAAEKARVGQALLDVAIHQPVPGLAFFSTPKNPGQIAGWVADSLGVFGAPWMSAIVRNWPPFPNGKEALERLQAERHQYDLDAAAAVIDNVSGELIAVEIPNELVV